MKSGLQKAPRWSLVLVAGVVFGPAVALAQDEQQRPVISRDVMPSPEEGPAKDEKAQAKPVYQAHAAD